MNARRCSTSSTETKIPDGDVDLPAKVGGAELELDDVTFDGKGRWRLKGVSLKLKPGESVGIVGTERFGEEHFAETRAPACTT